MHKGAWTRLPETKQALRPGAGRRTTESPELDTEAEPRSQAICPLGGGEGRGEPGLGEAAEAEPGRGRARGRK